MKKTILTVGLAIFLVTAFTAISSACDKGCTPGYWKQTQHFGNWTGYSPDNYVDDVFSCGPHITLLEGLQTGGGDINALTRHAVAALLNAAQWSCFDGGCINDIISAYCSAIAGNSDDIEELKDRLAQANEENDCPLGRAELQTLPHKLYLIRTKK
jgi:hypothetical protein